MEKHELNNDVNSDVYKDFFKQEYIERKSRIKRSVRWLLSAYIIIVPIMVLALIIESDYPNQYLDKKNLKHMLNTLIQNEADLATVKHAYENFPRVKKYKVIYEGKNNFYENILPLSYILNDMKVEAYQDGNVNSITLIDNAITEYNSINPFDNLLKNQRYYFDNIRVKSKDSYDDIASDINNIADELHQKNLVIDNYLRDSTLSFWISVIALVLSILIGGYQIWIGRSKVMKKLITESLADLSEEASRIKK